MQRTMLLLSSAITMPSLSLAKTKEMTWSCKTNSRLQLCLPFQPLHLPLQQMRLEVGGVPIIQIVYFLKCHLSLFCRMWMCRMCVFIHLGHPGPSLSLPFRSGNTKMGSELTA
ncbi:hypothetical protein M758_UG343600 [Ceratodon purpureus]|nr:hypothetical protein M758_UG343600 [Ceratodon purpureus]